MLLGLDRYTGEALKGIERAAQSVETTLSTPYRSQPGQRGYGSELPRIISEPFSEDNVMRVFGALVDAFEWEPEASLINYGLRDADELGRTAIWYRARYLPTNEIFVRAIGRDLSRIDGGVNV